MRAPAWAFEAQRRAQQSKEAAMSALRRIAAECGNPEAQETLREIRKEGDPEKEGKRAHWAGTGIVPPDIRRALKTQGPLAVASFILYQIKKVGVCDKAYGYIAKCTGYCKKTVQRTVAVLRRFGIEVVRRFDKPSIIKTTCSKIYRWISRNATSGHGGPNKLIIERTFLRPIETKEDRRLRRLREAPS